MQHTHVGGRKSKSKAQMTVRAVRCDFRVENNQMCSVDVENRQDIADVWTCAHIARLCLGDKEEILN